MENIVVPFFWLGLYPTMDLSKKEDKIKAFLEHIAPMAFLLIDFIFNRILFSFRLLPFAILIILVYGFCFNMVVSLVRGVPVYSILDPDSWESWLIALSLPLVQALLYAVWVYYTRWRNSKYT